MSFSIASGNAAQTGEECLRRLSWFKRMVEGTPVDGRIDANLCGKLVLDAPH